MNTRHALLFLGLLAAPASATDPESPPLGDPLWAAGAGFTYRPHDGAAHDHGGWTASRPDGHAPIGVMGDHLHNAGEWMVSLRVMRMHMDGMTNNGNDLSSADVLAQGFMVTPTEMDMDMLMLGAMYAVSDDWTLMLMLPYIRNEMDHVTGMGVQFTTKSEGLGDIRLTGMYSLYDRDGHRVHLNAGLSVPTGSIDETDDTPAMAGARLPYPMQLGTGTFDLLPGITYLGQEGDWSWGAQVTPRFHLDDNDEGYRRGNRIDATGWVARRLGALSLSFRLDLGHWSNIHGADPNLNPNMVPTADPDLQGGDRLDALVGVNYHFHEGSLAGHRLALEVGVPAYQDLDGPQLETDWIATFGWQFSW